MILQYLVQKRAIWTLIFCASFGSVVHGDLFTDNFTNSMPDYVLPNDPNWGSNYIPLTSTYFESMSVGAANRTGDGSYTVSMPGNGTLSSTGHGTAGGTLTLSYNARSSHQNLSAADGIRVSFSKSNGPLEFSWGVYSNDWNNSSGKTLTLTSSYAGTLNMSFAELGGDTLLLHDVQQIWINVKNGIGGSSTITSVTVGAVPEPTSLLALGCGVLALSRSLRRKHSAKPVQSE